MNWKRTLLYALVFTSGAAGLMYQVAWHRYLAILLGAEARATATIIAVFLGGLSLGYFLFGRWSRKAKGNLLLAYCLVEICLALWALAFPVLFSGLFKILPTLSHYWLFNTFFGDMMVAALLLLVPTTLMGGTLPLLTQALGETLVVSSETHAKLYGFNTVGACFGSLLAGYVLLPSTPIPTTVYLAGALNALVAGVSWFLFGRKEAKAMREGTAGSDVAVDVAPLDRSGQVLLAIAFISGFATITLETVLMRLMGLSAGSSAYHFTLIVSVFVLALGLGSLWLRRADKYGPRELLLNQGAVFVTLLALYFAADRWPYWVHRVRILFRDNPETFHYYQAALGGGGFLVLFVPIALCGLTLPLCFHLLRDDRRTLGYRVGQLYAVNTLGCVAGALIGGYALLQWLNLDALFRLCVGCYALSFALAAAFRFYRGDGGRLDFRWGAGAALVGAVTAAILPGFHRERYVQPFRMQQPVEESYFGLDLWTQRVGGSSDFVFYKDGPNTTVAVGKSTIGGKERSRTLLVNGKSDGNTKGDFLTMALTGILPGLFAPSLDRACVIGFGTGITAGALLSFDEVRHIDVVDIASTVIDAAPFFDSYNGRVTQNAKASLHATDAFRFLRRATEKYNVIVSEPSNPWVTGVENLYTSDYYDVVADKLTPDGLFVQWVQAYSFRDDLLQMVLRTVSSRFPYVTVFQMLEHDMAIVASRSPRDAAQWATRGRVRFEGTPQAKGWALIGGLKSFEAVLALELMPPGSVPAIAEDAPIHQLLSPKLSHEAAIAFFSTSSARPHTLRRQFKEFYSTVNDALLPRALGGHPPSAPILSDLRETFCEDGQGRNRALCSETVAASLVFEGKMPAGGSSALSASEEEAVRLFATPVKSKTFGSRDLNDVQNMFQSFKKLRSPIFPVSAEPMVARLELCIASVGRELELHGDCLLELAAVLEVTENGSNRFAGTLDRFDRWFAATSPAIPGYSRFQRASQIMGRMRNVASQVGG